MGNLILPIKKKWFHMILSGEKKEEYREIKPYYQSRFRKIFYILPQSLIPAGNEHRQIMFRNGYSRKSPSFIADCTLDIKQGKEEWGAESGVEYYVLTIHKIIWRSMDNMSGYLKIAV